MGIRGFESFDHYMNVFQNRGRDYANADEFGRPKKVELKDFLEAGREELQQTCKNISMSDAISSPDITPWLPQVIQRTVLETQEPMLVLTGLFQQMAYEAGQVIEFPAVGAVTAQFVAEDQAVPEVRLQESGGTTTAKVGKAGVGFKLTSEAMRYSRYDLMGMHMRECAKALARLKEKTAANFLAGFGTVAFDNVYPTSSVYGVTHGRNLAGTANGSMILDDLFDAMVLGMEQGWNMDTLIMHPLSFMMFVKDPATREVMLAGGNQIYFGNWTGNAAARASGSGTHVSGGQAIVPGGAASSETATGRYGYNQTMTSAPQLPGYWPWPLKIVVSPFVWVDPGTKRTNITLCNSAELGYYIVDYPVRVDRWEDLSTDVTRVKLVEAYCFHMANEGLATIQIKNVKLVDNMVALPPRAATVTISDITATTPVL